VIKPSPTDTSRLAYAPPGICPAADAKREGSQHTNAAPLAYGIEAACEAAGVKRDTIYRAIRRGELIARKIGTRTVILADDLRAWLASMPAIEPRKAA
jgi:excisionase family DNA binding protein